MKLEQLMEKEPELRRFHDRITQIIEGGDMQCQEPEVITFLEAHMGEMYDKFGVHTFRSIVDILNTGFEEWWDDRQTSIPYIPEFLETLWTSADVNNPYFHLCLDLVRKVALEDFNNKSTHAQIGGFFHSFYSPFVSKVPSILLDAEEKLKPNQMENLIAYLKNSVYPGYIDQHCLIEGLEALPAAYESSAQFPEQFESLLDMLGKIKQNCFTGMLVIEHFSELCSQLQQMGKLDYYDKIAKKLAKILDKRPYNARFFVPDNTAPVREFGIPSLLKSYADNGLLHEFFPVLDSVLSFYNMDDSKAMRHYNYPKYKPRYRNNFKIQEEIDPLFAYFMNYPELRKIFGENTSQVLLPLLDATKNGVELVEIFESAYEFLARGLHRERKFDQWLSHIKKTIDDAVFDIGYRLSTSVGEGLSVDSGFLMDSVDAVTNNISLDSYAKFTRQISENRLFGKTQALKEILEANIPKSKKKEIIDYYSILKDLPGLPKISLNSKWIQKISKKYGLDHAEFLEWMDSVVQEKNRVIAEIHDFLDRYTTKQDFYRICREEELNNSTHQLEFAYHRITEYIDNVPMFLEKGFNLQDSLSIAKSFFFKGIEFNPDFYRDLINSDRTIEDKQSLLWRICSDFKGREDLLRNIVFSDLEAKEITKFLYQIHNSKKMPLLDAYAPLNTDFDDWLEKAEKKAETYFADHGAPVSYPKDVTLTLLANTPTPQSRADLIKLAQYEAERIQRKKYFTLGKVYKSEKVYGLRKNIEGTEATRLLLYGLLSRRNERIEEAASYFDLTKLSLARSYIEGSHLSAGQFYARNHRLVELTENGALKDGKKQICQDIIRDLQECYLSSPSNSEGKSELRELVWLVESLLKGDEVFDEITAKMQDGTMYDLFGGRELLCCAMMSQDRERTEIESLYYALDRYIALLHIVPSLEGKPQPPIGAGILVNTLTKSGNYRVLLLDSLEGGTAFQKIDPEISFRLAARGILGAAQDSGSEYLLINTHTSNVTPKKFADYIGGLVNSTPLTTELIKIQDNQTVQRQRRFLESFKDKEKLAGSVEGYLIRTDRLAAMIK